MPEIVFEGGSDDLIEVEGPVARADGVFNGDEFGVGPEAGEIDAIGAIMGRFELLAPTGERLDVTALFNGCWSFAAGQCKGDGVHIEEFPWPGWPVRVEASRQSTSYSTALVIDAPAGTMVRKV